MLVSQKLAIAAHMHVLLRRKTGRVTDTEWMAANLEYALEIVRFARAKAAEDSVPELAEWADKLERAALEEPAAKRPLAQTAMTLLREKGQAAAPAAPQPQPAEPAEAGFGHSTFSNSSFGESTFEPERPRKVRELPPLVPRYVGGIR